MPRRAAFGKKVRIARTKVCKTTNRTEDGKFVKDDAKRAISKRDYANVFVGKKPTPKVMHPRTCSTMAEFAAIYDYEPARQPILGAQSIREVG
jgi:hypothetical protein